MSIRGVFILMLLQYNISDANTDEYVNAFLPTARDLISRAEEAENHRNTQIAGDLYTYVPVLPLQDMQRMIPLGKGS